ncbi:MAG: hypothetical protein WCI71_05890 [Bacteroidota bacterium]
MTRDEFIILLVEEIEITSIKLTPLTQWSKVLEYDSMAVMTIVALCDEYFGKKFTALQVGKMKTVSELLEAIGI